MCHTNARIVQPTLTHLVPRDGRGARLPWEKDQKEPSVNCQHKLFIPFPQKKWLSKWFDCQGGCHLLTPPLREKKHVLIQMNPNESVAICLQKKCCLKKSVYNKNGFSQNLMSCLIDCIESVSWWFSQSIRSSTNIGLVRLTKVAMPSLPLWYQFQLLNSEKRGKNGATFFHGCENAVTSYFIKVLLMTWQILSFTESNNLKLKNTYRSQNVTPNHTLVAHHRLQPNTAIGNPIDSEARVPHRLPPNIYGMQLYNSIGSKASMQHKL